ncbi:MAG: hypothetical protein AYK19_19410 [Theionarchaea archaeon DG-70-1]|nr:MAG: hypothetical protein AYK19_19410 [Theionarchaea archaeon DG-70-1]
MSWVQYKVVLRLLSPLHIGWRKVGNLQQTRKYVTGKVFWAALTARLTRDMGRGTRGKAYVDMGNKICEHFRFSYFYPALQNDVKEIESVEDLDVYYPWGEKDFDYLFLNSYASTAMDRSNRTSEEGTLHETEFISPRSRNGEQVHLVGDIWVKDQLLEEVKEWDKSLGYLRLGGERSYGWGQVEPAFDPVKVKRLEEIRIKNKKHVLAHVDAINIRDELKGHIEPLVGWEHDIGKGWTLTKNVKLAFVPGSVVTCDSITFAVDSYGIWRMVRKN